MIGRGGQGEVWRARDTQHDRTVALKVRHIDAGTDRDALLREAHLLLGLRPHRALPIVREDFFEGDDYYVVMDWVDGTSLDVLLERYGDPGLPFDTVLSYARQVASALDHLHAHDPPVVHQDVKPSNIIVRPDGEVVLVDFGISAPAGDRVTEGTPAYRAPELASEASDPRADVYGLAATTFALLTGAPPRPGPRPSLQRVDPVHAARVWAALESGLAYDPSQRPSSARELVRALEPTSERSNLPVFTARFIGREPDIAAVADTLMTDRLVTLCGPGGVGKTRLGIEAATRLAPAYADGTWMVSFAPIRDPRIVARVVAGVFGLETHRPTDELLGTLQRSNLLLLLDNCEHVLEGVVPLVRGLLESCPGVDVLATSRERLGIATETVRDVQPLGVPDEDAIPKAVALADSVRLFLERTASERVHVRLTTDLADTIGRICRRLDGMPLAIELAASHAGRLDIHEIAERLDDRFALLRSSDATTPRHQTLFAAIDWSYSMLSDVQRSLFTRLSVFPGGFDRSDARALGIDVADIDAELRELAGKSLIVETDDGARFSMLETVRSFATSKLEEAGDARITRDLARRWLLEVAAEARSHLEGPERSVWLARGERSLDNVREAIALAVDDEPADVLRLVTDLGQLWTLHAHWSEARRYVEAALGSGAGDPALRADASALAGHLAFLEADYDGARNLHGEALRIRRSIGDERASARSLAGLGNVAEARGDYESARDLYGSSLEISRRLGDEREIAEQLTNLGSVAEYTSDYEIAQTLHEESLSIRREIADEQGVATTLLNLGYVAAYRGDGRGRAFLEESIELFTKVGDRYGASRAINLLAIRTWFEGDGVKAKSLGEEALRMRVEIGDRLGIAVSLESLAGLGAFQGFGAYAGTLFGAAERLREIIASPVTPSDQVLVVWAHTDAKKLIGEDAFDAARAEGRAMRLDDAIALALSRPA